MLPSVLPRFATDSAVRVFPGVWKLLSFKDSLPRTQLPPYLFCLFFCLLYFFLPLFENNELLFSVPDVLCWHSEVVLWNLLSVEMFFWWICGGESGLPVLFLCHLRTAPCFFKINLFFNWRIIALQDFVVFWQTSTWIRHVYICLLPPEPPSYFPLHPTPPSCYRVLYFYINNQLGTR